MSTASPETASITVPSMLATTPTAAKRDPYLIWIPRESTFVGRVAWMIGEALFIVSVTITGLGVMLWMMAAVIDAAGQATPYFGDTGLMVFPYGVAGILTSRIFRRWRTRVDRRTTVQGQTLELLLAAAVSIAAGVVVEVVVRYGIMIVALFVR